MRQKLGLCCALVHDPDLLILDEPTTGVDPLSRRQFWDLIGRMREQRPDMTVIVATAYMEEAERFERVIAMNAGAILAARHAGRDQGAGRTRDAGGKLRRAAAGVHCGPVIRRCTFRRATTLARRAGDRGARTHAAVRRLHRRRSRQLHDRARRDLRLRRLERLRQDDDDEDADRAAAGDPGEATLFGQTVDGTDVALRRRVGYMSQSFSLYTELTVRQNLALHARLFHLPRDHARASASPR